MNHWYDVAKKATDDAFNLMESNGVPSNEYDSKAGQTAFIRRRVEIQFSHASDWFGSASVGVGSLEQKSSPLSGTYASYRHPYAVALTP